MRINFREFSSFQYFVGIIFVFFGNTFLVFFSTFWALCYFWKTFIFWRELKFENLRMINYPNNFCGNLFSQYLIAAKNNSLKVFNFVWVKFRLSRGFSFPGFSESICFRGSCSLQINIMP